MMRRWVQWAGVIGLALCAGGRLAGAQERGAVPARGVLAGVDRGAGPMRGVLARYAADREALGRTYPTPMSAKRDVRTEAFLDAWQAGLAAIDFDALDPEGRIDYVLFRNHLAHERRRLTHEQARNAEVAALAPFLSTVVSLAEARRRFEPMDARKAAEQLATLREQIDDTREELEKTLEKEKDDERPAGTIKKTVANRAARRVRKLRGTLEKWQRFYDAYDPTFTWWTKKPYERANEALEKYAKFLREKVAKVEKDDDDDAVIGDPIGREALLADLAAEMIPYPPEELIAIANREFAWCETEMRRASRELGFGDDWSKTLAHVKNLHVAPGKQPDLIRDLAYESVAFLEERDLLTIPPLCKEIWRMEMMSPERQKVNPYFTGGEVISVSFPTDGMTHEQKMMSMRGNNIHFARATVHHELIPGHHLQIFMADRYRTHRKLFRTPFFVEGWALYWEMLLWDLNFAQSAEDRVGMLFWRSHRCARIIFSLKFHLEQMTADEAIEFLIERVGHERANATAEVRRSVNGNYSPLYQCAYMLGGLQLRALHKELVGSGKMTDRAFHDAVLRENAIPIEMVRASLTGQSLTRDYTSQWKFAGNLP